MDGCTLEDGGIIPDITTAQGSEIRGGKPRRFLLGERSQAEV